MNSNPAVADEIRKYEEQYSRSPESLVFARLADAYRKAGEPERALAVLEEGLARHADYVSGHIVRARVFADLGRRREAVEAFEDVLRLEAGNVIALRSLSDLALDVGDRDSARAWLIRLVQVDPLSEEARRRLEALEAEMPPPEGASPAPEPGGAETSPAEPRPSREEEGRLPAEEVEARGWAAEIAWWKELPASGPEPGEDGSPWRDLWERDPAPPPLDDEEEGDLRTRTMAELYARQGLLEEAVEIYEELLEQRPGDLELVRLREEARARLARGAASAPAAPAPHSAARSRPAPRASGPEAAAPSAPAPPAAEGPETLGEAPAGGESSADGTTVPPVGAEAPAAGGEGRETGRAPRPTGTGASAAGERGGTVAPGASATSAFFRRWLAGLEDST